MTDFNKIVPMANRCRCGKSINNHHFLCDNCWGIKCKNNQIVLDIIRKRELQIIQQKNKIIKKLENKIKNMISTTKTEQQANLTQTG